MLYKQTCHWQCCCESWAACYRAQAAWGDGLLTLKIWALCVKILFRVTSFYLG